MPDKLVGTKTVVETRLAKYVAVSLLTRDLLDTSAVRKMELLLLALECLVVCIGNLKPTSSSFHSSPAPSIYKKQKYIR